MKRVISIIADALALVAFLVGVFMACLLDSGNWMIPFATMCIAGSYLFLYAHAKGWMH